MDWSFGELHCVHADHALNQTAKVLHIAGSVHHFSLPPTDSQLRLLCTWRVGVYQGALQLARARISLESGLARDCIFGPAQGFPHSLLDTSAGTILIHLFPSALTDSPLSLLPQYRHAPLSELDLRAACNLQNSTRKAAADRHS